MSHCLHDRALWSVLEGDTSDADQAHVTSCVTCTARLRQLERDLHQLRSALSAPPPPQAVRPPQRIPWRPWMAAAAACAILALVVWGTMWWPSTATPPLPSGTVPFMWSGGGDLGEALVPMAEMAVSGTPEPLTDFDDWQAALVGGWPCEEPVAFGNPACHNEPLTLLLSEQ